MNAPNVIRPLLDNIYVQRLKPSVSPGGIIFPETFKAGKNGRSARQKFAAIPDLFHARVLAVGPDVRELAQGDEVIVYSYADSDGSKVFTGESVGEKDKFFIKPGDVVCAVEP
jgi:co-chaperonin GroES (HSP10)